MTAATPRGQPALKKKPQDSPRTDGRLATLLKWIGAISAVISLLVGLNQVTGLVQKLRIHHKEFSEAMKAGDQEQERGDYPAAFASFKRATEIDQIDHEAQTREVKAAMLWLENVHAKDRSFTEISNQLLPVLDNALTRAKGSDAADILAHIGWANFLRYRDGSREGINIDENLNKALSVDSSNVYAHAISGFWVLWQNGKLAEANKHFSSALATGRARPYVRDLQISALINVDRDDTNAELLRIANEMRKSGESLSPRQRERIFWNDFSSRIHSRDELIRSLSVLSAQDTEATYDWLNTTNEADVEKKHSREFVLANLAEVAGNRSEALSRYKALQKELHGSYSMLVGPVDDAVRRLLSGGGAY